MAKAWMTLPPREKMIKYGAEMLSDAELLALFLRTGTRTQHVIEVAERLLSTFGSLRRILLADSSELNQVGGIGVAKFTQLHAIAELADRFYDSQSLRDGSLNSPHSTRRFLQRRLMRQQREIFMVIFLDNQHQVLTAEEMFAGTFNSVEVHPREIIRRALKLNAAALIVAHNHPSGVPEPSRADRQLTEQLRQSCTFFSIQLLDHLVIGHGCSVSFAERGWL
ncbi:RadC family protein [Izhakiella australiensis]|nr:DNA repair protein RadC [Izhakiella australiensis]